MLFRSAIHISDKIDFKIKTITRDKEGYYIMIKGSIQEEEKAVKRKCTVEKRLESLSWNTAKKEVKVAP